MESVLEDFEQRFAELDPTDFEPLAELTKEKEGIRNDLGALYEEWEELSADAS